MSLVISHIDRTITILNEAIARCETKGPGHKLQGMTEWYEDRARSLKSEITELEFIRGLAVTEEKIRQQVNAFHEERAA